MFNVYMQPYGYDRHAPPSDFPKPSTQSKDRFFLLHLCVVSPPAPRRWESYNIESYTTKNRLALGYTTYQSTDFSNSYNYDTNNNNPCF